MGQAVEVTEPPEAPHAFWHALFCLLAEAKEPSPGVACGDSPDPKPAEAKVEARLLYMIKVKFGTKT